MKTHKDNYKSFDQLLLASQLNAKYGKSCSEWHHPQHNLCQEVNITTGGGVRIHWERETNNRRGQRSVISYWQSKSTELLHQEEYFRHRDIWHGDMGRHTRYNGENTQDVQIVVLKAVLGLLCDRRVAETLGQEGQGKMPKLRNTDQDIETPQ